MSDYGIATDDRDVSEVVDGVVEEGMDFERYFSNDSEHPFEEIEWEESDVEILGPDGDVVFEQEGIEHPVFWSQKTVQIVASKYFYGSRDEEFHETSVKELVLRVATTIRKWGEKDNIFATEEDAEIFEEELTWLLVNQYCAFNSPVWFNCGLYHYQDVTEGDMKLFTWDEENERVKQVDKSEGPYKYPQCSACFLLPIEDSMEDILEHAKREGRIFKYGSGTGTNFSSLRASGEPVSGGGEASGPLSFMRIYDSVGGAIQSGGKNRRAAKMDILNVDHPDIKDFIWAKKKQEDIARILVEQHDYDDSMDGLVYQGTVRFQNSNQSVRITDEFMRSYEDDGTFWTKTVLDEEKHTEYEAREILNEIAESAWDNAEPGVQFHDTINKWHTCKNDGEQMVTNPCSEFLFLENVSCNLASHRLTRYVDDDGEFDVESFKTATRTLFTAQELLVDNSGYPTEDISQGCHDYRTIGMGYADVGAMLMKLGIPYDSEKGRDLIASITSLMCGQCYKTSSEISSSVGPYPRFEANEEPHMEVMRMHMNEGKELYSKMSSSDYPYEKFGGEDWSYIADEGVEVWEDAYRMGEEYGYRNSQVTAIAPTGTISFYMGCDTTGIEPEYALVKYKRMSGGGYMKLVNESVKQALRNLGYDDEEVEEVVEYIDENEKIEGAPHVKDKHLSVFDTANTNGDGDRRISPMGHVDMMAAVQPFVSGGISKTCNLPSDSTVEDIKEIYYQAWKKGVKCIAVYRDGSKGTEVYDDVDSDEEEGGSVEPDRKKLPDERESVTHKFSISGHEGYITVGMYEDGSPGEVFIMMSKEGSIISGLMDSVAIVTSVSLQYGVPLKVLVKKFINTRFEPSGWTENDDIPMARSLMDYVFRWLGEKFLDEEEWNNIQSGSVSEENEEKIRKAMEEADISLDSKEATGPLCDSCGSVMEVNGTCHVCPNCGETTGCG